jgi:hypothetical protein
MKLSRLFVLAGCILSFALPASQASATVVPPVVNYSGNFVDMTPTPLEIGQSGTITSTGAGFGNAVLSLITGSLPSNSMITFSYNFAGTLTSSFLTTSGGYSYVDGGVSHIGYTTATAPGGFGFSASFENASPVAPLALSSAQITGSNSASVIIKNLSAGALSYATAFMGTVLGSKNFTVAYNVSAVPIPAALPLFGLGLGALAFARSRARKKQKQELAA